MMFKYSCIVLILFTFSSCHLAKDEKALTKYIANPDHGLSIAKKVNGIDLKVTYRPQDFLVKQELDGSNAKEPEVISKLRQQYEKQLYFILSLSKNNQEVLNSMAGNHAEFSEMVNKLAFGMGENITLVTSNKDTLQLVDYIYPRMYGMSNSTDILIAFRNRDISKAEYIKLTIADLGLQTGDVTFKFQTNDIINAPKLKLQQK